MSELPRLLAILWASGSSGSSRVQRLSLGDYVAGRGHEGATAAEETNAYQNGSQTKEKAAGGRPSMLRESRRPALGLEAPPPEEAEGTAEQEERGRPGNGCRLDLSLFAAGQPDARADGAIKL